MILIIWLCIPGPGLAGQTMRQAGAGDQVAWHSGGRSHQPGHTGGRPVMISSLCTHSKLDWPLIGHLAHTDSSDWTLRTPGSRALKTVTTDVFLLSDT